jgi:hypothetical protein
MKIHHYLPSPAEKGLPAWLQMFIVSETIPPDDHEMVDLPHCNRHFVDIITTSVKWLSWEIDLFAGLLCTFFVGDLQQVMSLGNPPLCL